MHTIGRGALAAGLTLAAVALGTADARAQLLQPNGGGVGQQAFPTAGSGRTMTMVNGQSIPSFQNLNTLRNPYNVPGLTTQPWTPTLRPVNRVNNQLWTPPPNYNPNFYPGPINPPPLYPSPYYPGPVNFPPYNPYNPLPYNPYNPPPYNPYNPNQFVPPYAPPFNPYLPYGPYNPPPGNLFPLGPYGVANPGFNPYVGLQFNNTVGGPFGPGPFTGPYGPPGFQPANPFGTFAPAVSNPGPNFYGPTNPFLQPRGNNVLVSPFGGF